MKHRESTHEEFFTVIAKNIAEFKQQVLSVGNSLKEPAFAYTIGNQEKLLPELLIIGNFDPEIQDIILNDMSDFMITQKRRFADGELYSLGGKHAVKVIDAKDPQVKREWTVQAGQFYRNEDYEVQQVVAPDTKGNWPEDPKCHLAFKVPVLKGPRLILPT